MTHKPAFHKALRALTHPLTLAAMLLLATNDLLLKPLFPSWITGKLSDLAILFFLPFLLLAGLAWITHSRWERMVEGTAFLAPGLLFAIVKMIPGANAWVRQAFAGMGFPIRLALDPSDLLALAALPAAWWLYRKPVNLPGNNRRALWLLPLAALLLLGDAAAPDPGVSCITSDGSALLAEAGYNRQYTSVDGGLTWQIGEQAPLNQNACDSNREEVDGTGPDRFRFTPGGPIERSADEGETWQTDYRPKVQSEAENAYAMKVLPSNAVLMAGPKNAAFDPKTGNIIFSMGHEGVLVRRADGQYQCVAIGQYDHAKVAGIPAGGYLTLLLGEVFLALLASLMGFNTILLRARHRWWQITLVALGWLAWLFTALIVPPAITNGGYGPTMSGMALLGTAVWAVIVLLVLGIGTLRAKIFVGWKAELILILTAAVFLIPYIMWAVNWMPDYYLAALIAIGVVVVGIVVGMRGSVPPNPKSFGDL